MTRSRLTVAAILALGLLAACGGSSSPGQATRLDYEDPASTGWRLVRDPASPPGRLLLALVGPVNLLSRGAAFNLVAPPGVRFRRFESTGFPVEPGAVYELLNTRPFGAPDPLEPKLVAGGVKPGNLLTVGVFQKDRRATAKPSGAPLFRIALELDGSAGLAAGTDLPLRVVKAGYVAEDIGAFSPYPNAELAAKGHITRMTVDVGALRAY